MKESNRQVLGSVVSAVESGERLLCLNGVTSPASKAFIIHELHKFLSRPIAVIAATNAELEALENDLLFWLTHSGSNESSLVTLPSYETDPYAGVSPHAETLEKRALALWQLASGKGDLVLASARSLVTRAQSTQLQ